MSNPFIKNSSSEGGFLSNLKDCRISAPTDNQILGYNTTSGSWENKNPSVTISALDDLSNVLISNPTNDQVLLYNSTASKWFNHDGVTDNSVTDFTNKTLDDATNDVVANAIRSATTRIDIDNAQDPSNKQALIISQATMGFPYKASWQTINHTNLSNIGTNTHAQIDSHISATNNVHGVAGAVVGTSDSQTLTNKNLTDASNNITAKYLKSATTVVDVSASPAPEANQVLTAVNSTVAIWDNPKLMGNSVLNFYWVEDIVLVNLKGQLSLTGTHNFINLDTTSMFPEIKIILPHTNLGYNYVVYIQFQGTSNICSSVSIVPFDNLKIYTALNVISLSINASCPSSYMFSYCPAGANIWAPDLQEPSWRFVDLNNNYIQFPISNNQVLLVNSKNKSITAKMAIPQDILNGTHFYFLDIGGYFATCNIELYAPFHGAIGSVMITSNKHYYYESVTNSIWSL